VAQVRLTCLCGADTWWSNWQQFYGESICSSKRPSTRCYQLRQNSATECRHWLCGMNTISYYGCSVFS